MMGESTDTELKPGEGVRLGEHRLQEPGNCRGPLREEAVASSQVNLR